MVALVCVTSFGASALAAPATPSKPSKSSKSAQRRAAPAAKRTKPKGKPSAKAQRKARRAKSHFSSPDDVSATPAYRYAQLTQDECEAELVERGIGFVRESARGVLAPVRLTGPLRGVQFRTDLKETARATSPWEIGDCRLVLALDDFAEILNRHDIVEVRHYSMWRPPAESWPETQIATRHPGALALDAGRFIAKDGTVLDVDKHFHGRIGAKTCGDGAAPRPATPEAVQLRAILCETAERRLFNVVLTPNYDRPHKNHFHLELTEGVRWFLVH